VDKVTLKTSLILSLISILQLLKKTTVYCFLIETLPTFGFLTKQTIEPFRFTNYYSPIVVYSLNTNMKLSTILIPCLVLFSSILLFSNCSTDDEGSELKSTIFIEDFTAFEGSDGVTEFIFKIRTTLDNTSLITVAYTTQDGSAIAGEDYVSQSGTVTIPAGSREAIITIEILTDTVVEMNEDFKVIISNASNADISENTAIGTINNDDIISSNDDGYTTPTSYPGYTLTWSDEFNGTDLNLSDWNYETGNNGWGNNELQNYQSGTNNAYLENGKLVIEAKQESVGGSNYTSARLTTQGKQSFQFGRIDMRAKLPQGQGIWPALWMLGESFSTVGWPACGEIDVMELIGNEPGTVHGTVHYENGGTYNYNGNGTSLSSGIFADEFHVFTIIWNASAITWYLDDVMFHSINISPAQLSEFRAPFFFIANVAVGGNWPGSPNSSTVFPQKMEVDYIRVFQ
jgi:glycosyl hydrolase family 16/Calx-beta domain-containing protein